MTAVESYMTDIRDSLSVEKIVSDFELGLKQENDTLKLTIQYVTGDPFLDHEVAMVIIFPLEEERICQKLLEQLYIEKSKYPLSLGYGADCSQYIK